MYKKKSIKKLGKPKDQREALIRSQVKDLILNTYLKTTKARGKEVIRKLGQLVPFAKEKNLKYLFGYLRDKDLAKKLMTFTDQEKVTGYVSMVEIGNRPGDNAEKVLLELSLPEKKDESTVKSKSKAKNK